MAYLTFEEYQQAGGKLAEQDFAQAEERAEFVLDTWTFGRLQGDGNELLEHYAKSVKFVMRRLVDVPETAIGGGGDRVSSFSNGVDSFGFDVSKSESAQLYESLYWYLPPELITIAVDVPEEGGGCRARCAR